jgi:predicted dehydrogenase
MLRGGVIGLGNLGTRYTRLIAQDPRTTLGGVFDSDADVNARGAAANELPTYDTPADLLEHADLDFVYVGTPDFAHGDLVIQAAEAGLHLLVEKPLATSVEEAEAMVAAVMKVGVKAQIAFTNRFNQPFVAAKRAVEEGRLGAIQSVNTRLNDSIFVPTQMLSWASKSSPAWFLMSHTVDVASWLGDKRVATVYATGVKKVLNARGIDTFDSLQACLTYTDGTHGIFESSWVLPIGLPIVFDFRFEMVGTEGSISIDTHDQMLHIITDAYRHQGTLDIDVNGRLLGQTAFNFQAFIDALEGNHPPSPSLEDGLENVRVLEAVHRSAETGEVVHLR